jgi:hypothetical protein
MASVMLFDLDSDGKTARAARTSDLSAFGCLVVPGDTSPIGARVRLQITYMREVFEAVEPVIHTRQLKGLGIAFTKIEDHHQLVLEKWLTELRHRKFRANPKRPAFSTAQSEWIGSPERSRASRSRLNP